MKNITRLLGIITILAVIGLSFTACSKSGGGGGGKSINSAEALKEYLDSQPANSPDKPIKVSMSVNDMMIKNVAEVIKNTDKYVSLDLSKSVGLTAIGYFERAKPLVGIILPNSVTSIYSSAFSGTNLTSVTIPNSVTSIHDWHDSFRYCQSLTAINVADGNTVYASQDGVWYNKDKTTLIQYPAGKTDVSFTIPNSVTMIESYAFIGCTNLTSVTIPYSVTSIGFRTFRNCTNLTSVTFERGDIEIVIDDARRDNDSSFSGNLGPKYQSGKAGTYTTTAPVDMNSTWTKQ